MMTSDWLLADDIILMIDEMVLAAPHRAFKHHGHVHFYSGPSDKIWRARIEPKTKCLFKKNLNAMNHL